MQIWQRYAVSFLLIAGFFCSGIGVGTGQAAGNGTAEFANVTSLTGAGIGVGGGVALSSLMTIGDNHLVKIADTFRLLSTRDEVIAGDWGKIKVLLSDAAAVSVPALMWYALPSGEYRTVTQDLVPGNLQSRPYFSKVLSGKTVIGDLVVSKATGKNVAIVAVPILKDKKVVGILGSSVYLDKLSERMKQEMALPGNLIFYSFDSKPLLALVWDQGLIFKEPKDLGPEVDQAFREMLQRKQGRITYSFRGKVRMVLYKKSDITNWWYAFGSIQNGSGSGTK